MSGIFLNPGKAGGVQAKITKNAVDIATTDGSSALYYPDNCINKVDYMSLNALMSEIISVLKEVNQEYNPNTLDNLAKAIIKLLDVDSYTPDKIFYADIPEHNICNPDFEVVLIERVEENGKLGFRLTKTPVNKILDLIDTSFRLDKPYENQLVKITSEDLTKMSVVMQDDVNNQGKKEHQLKTISFSKFIDYFKFDISKPFSETLESYKKEDKDAELVLVKKNQDSHTNQLISAKISDIIPEPSEFNPNLPFSQNIAESSDPTSTAVTVKKTDDGKNHFVLSNIKSSSNNANYKQYYYLQAIEASLPEVRVVFNSDEYLAVPFNPYPTHLDKDEREIQLLKQPGTFTEQDIVGLNSFVTVDGSKFPSSFSGKKILKFTFNYINTTYYRVKGAPEDKSTPPREYYQYSLYVVATKPDHSKVLEQLCLKVPYVSGAPFTQSNSLSFYTNLLDLDISKMKWDFYFKTCSETGTEKIIPENTPAFLTTVSTKIPINKLEEKFYDGNVSYIEVLAL